MRGVILLQAAANGAGAAVVAFYLQVVFPVELARTPREETLDLLVFFGYLAVVVVVGIPLNALLLRKAVSWLKEGRRPSETERRLTLSLPAGQTASAFLGWLGAAVIFGVLHEGDRRIGAGIVLAGVVTCSLLYLLLERHFRPVFERALGGTVVPGRREILPRLMIAWLLGSAVPLLAVGMIPITGDPAEIADLGWRMTLLVATCLVGGGLVMRAAAGAVAEPIEQVREAMGRVEEGDLSVRVPVDDPGELGRLAAGFNAMVEGLAERERLRDLFGRQVGDEVVRSILETGANLGGERRVVSVLFVDVNGYTAIAERMSPDELLSFLNSFFEVVVRVVHQRRGFVNKFEGDAALCVFGAPLLQPDHASRALDAAENLPLEVAKLTLAPRIGVGVATGEVLAGNVGTKDRFEYTVIGDVVNVASRLCDLAKQYPSGVLATAETVAAADPSVARRWREAGSIQVRGRSAPTRVYEPVGRRSPALHTTTSAASGRRA